MKFHDVILEGPFGRVRFNQCSDQEIKEWINYGIKKGATAIETRPSEVTL